MLRKTVADKRKKEAIVVYDEMLNEEIRMSQTCKWEREHNVTEISEKSWVIGRSAQGFMFFIKQHS